MLRFSWLERLPKDHHKARVTELIVSDDEIAEFDECVKFYEKD